MYKCKNMALELTTQPTQNEPVAVSECLRYVFGPDAGDVVSTPGAQAEVVFTFPASPTDPGNGTEFILWGFTFTTDDSTPYTATSFEVAAGDKVQTMNNFQSMILANFYFARAVTVDNDTGASTITLTWNDCGEQENFGAEQMFFDDIEGSAITSAAPTNGTTPVYVDGYRIVHRLWRVDLNNAANTGAVTEFEGIEPNKTCTAADSAAFDGMPTARDMIKTPLPPLDDTHPTVGYDGIVQYFTVEYGWVYRDSNCQPLSDDFNFSNRAMVWNAYFTPEDVYRIRKYWPGAPGGLPAGQSYVKFLTTQPAKMRVFIDSKCWLWYMINEGVQSFSTLDMRLSVTKKDGSGVLTSVVVTNSGYGVNAINVSPSYIISIGLSGVTADTLSHYTVRVFLDDTTQATEEITYYIAQGCDNPELDTDLYFLNPAGGISTVPVRVIEQTAQQEGTEILLDVPCTASRVDKGKYGGRTLTGVRSYESFVFRSFENSTAVTQFFRDLKLSPQRWVRRRAEDGTWIARKLIVEPGGVRIYSENEKVTVEITGYLGDIPVQSTTEPAI